MDNSIFEMEGQDFADDGDEIDLSYEMFEEEEDFNTICIFHHCCENLQRVSIRNARCIFYPQTICIFKTSLYERNTIVKCVTQKALIKFVRNAPSL